MCVLPYLSPGIPMSAARFRAASAERLPRGSAPHETKILPYALGLTGQGFPRLHQPRQDTTGALQ